MAENKQGKDPGWMCLWEKMLIRGGFGHFELVHDGQRNPGQFEFPPDDVRYFTRKYRAKMDGEFVNTWVVFKYDLREGEVGMDITCREPGLKGKEQMIMDMEGVSKNA